MIAWMGLALMVSTRLWLGGVVSVTRDSKLADQLLRQVRACVRAAGALLVATDGWQAYPNAIQRAFREKVKRTRTSLVAGVAATLYCDRDQAHPAKTGGRSHPAHGASTPGASGRPAASEPGRDDAQYRLY